MPGLERPGLAPFSPTVMEHFLEPMNMGTLASPSGEGWSGSREAGRFMRVQVLLEGDLIRAARFQTYGCAYAIASASFLTEWVRGRTVEEGLRLEPAELIHALGAVPARRRFCAVLAVDALRNALAVAIPSQSREGQEEATR